MDTSVEHILPARRYTCARLHLVSAADPKLLTKGPFNKPQIAAHKHMPPPRSASSSGSFYEVRWEKHGCRHLMGECKGMGGGAGRGGERRQQAWLKRDEAACLPKVPGESLGASVQECKVCRRDLILAGRGGGRVGANPRRGSMRGSVRHGSQRTV